jgi:energy-coupling factor transporter transmembrane protein EcfT
MAELTAFHYRPGTSALHRLDGRMKLVLLAVFSIVCFHLSFAGLLVLGAFLLAIAGVSRAAPAVRSPELRWMGILWIFVLIARAVSTDGTALFSIWALSVTREGVRDGVRICLRLALIVCAGSVFVATTRSSEIKAAVQWFLQPVPLIPAERVGTMLSLLIRFVPLIFEQTAMLSDAQRARAVENRRNPIERMALFGIPLLRRIFEASDRLVLAMEARCYSDSRTNPEFKAGARDWAMIGAGLALILTALVI